MQLRVELGRVAQLAVVEALSAAVCAIAGVVLVQLRVELGRVAQLAVVEALSVRVAGAGVLAELVAALASWRP